MTLSTILFDASDRENNSLIMDSDLKCIYSLRAHLKYVILLPIVCVGIFIFSLPVFIFVRALFELFIYCVLCFVMEITVNRYTYIHY